MLLNKRKRQINADKDARETQEINEESSNTQSGGSGGGMDKSTSEIMAALGLQRPKKEKVDIFSRRPCAPSTMMKRMATMEESKKKAEEEEKKKQEKKDSENGDQNALNDPAQLKIRRAKAALLLKKGKNVIDDLSNVEFNIEPIVGDSENNLLMNRSHSSEKK